MVDQYALEAVLVLSECFFTDETRVSISSDGILRVFRRYGTRFLEKILSSDKRSLMFWVSIRSDGRKLLVKCPNRLIAVGFLKILKIYEEKNAFPGPYFSTR